MQRSVRSITFLSFILLIACSSPERAEVESSKQLISHNWEFLIDSLDATTPDELGTDLSWQRINIPHTPRIEPLLVNDQWQGTCWYKKELDYNPDWQNKELFLRFEGAMNVAEVWVNDIKKIRHYGGYLPFVINISDDIIPDRPLSIYVRLNNEDNEVTGILSVTQDISKIKQAEQKLKESESKYREAYDRAEFYKDLFVHDINNILQGIILSSQISQTLVKKSNSSEKLEELLIQIGQSVERGTKLVKKP